MECETLRIRRRQENGSHVTRLLNAGPCVRVRYRETAVAALETGAQRAVRRPKWPASRTVFLSLPNPRSCRRGAGPRRVEGTRVKRVADFSTIGPRTAGIVARALAERKVTYVDAPVSGGLKGAREGTLAVMVSCPKNVYAELEPVLKTFGKPFHLGEVAGQAQTMKLANNLLAAAAIAVSSEAMVMGVKAGLDPKMMLDVLNAGTGRNSATQDKFPRAILPGTFDFGLQPTVVQGRALMRRRGRITWRAHGGRRRGAADAGGDQRGVRRRFRFHLDVPRGRVVGRRRSAQQVTGSIQWQRYIR
jgi:3-hydroxyisobutyrate dehydrogenase